MGWFVGGNRSYRWVCVQVSYIGFLLAGFGFASLDLHSLVVVGVSGA